MVQCMRFAMVTGGAFLFVQVERVEGFHFQGAFREVRNVTGRNKTIFL